MHEPTRSAVEYTIVSGGIERRYMLYVPPQKEKCRRARPLVLAFHGFLGSGRRFERLTGFDALADMHDSVVAYPAGIGRSWNAGIGAGPAERLGVDDVQFTEDIIDDIERCETIDPSRVFAAGMSNGGAFVHRLGCELSARLAAIVSVAASMGAEQARRCRPRRAVSVLMINGLEDDLMPYNGGTIFGGGTIISVKDSAAGWAERDGCKRPPTTRPVGPGITRTTFGPCACDTRVESYAIANAGHTWPGRRDRPAEGDGAWSVPTPDASALIWQFFAARRRR